MTGTNASRARHVVRRSRRAAVVAAVGLVAITLAAFVGLQPFKRPYEVRGVFTSANQLREGSEVRIAGVKVGEVSGVRAGPGKTSIVRLRIDDAARPIHADAELSIEPRLVLEGNFYVALRPGSPRADELPSGATIPQARTSIPVQLDQVLSTFDLATRGALHRSIAEMAQGLGAPTLTAGPGPATPPGSAELRRAVRELRGALPSATRVARALRGTDPGDLGRTLRSSRDTMAQLAADPRALADGISNFNRLTGALAAQDDDITSSVRSLERLMRTAPAGLSALDRALPPAEAFATALRPALRAAPRPLRRATAFAAQAQRLFGRTELSALLAELAPTFRDLPALERGLERFAPLVTRANRCLEERVAWVLGQKLQDGPNSTGDPVYLDAAHGFAGAGGMVAGFDGNGAATRVGITSNGTQISSILPDLGPIVGLGPQAEGVRPTWLGFGIEPPYRPDEWCATQPKPDLNSRSGPAPAMPADGRAMRVGGILP